MTARARIAVVGGAPRFRLSKCEPNGRERISELVRQRRQKFVLTQVGFHESGCTVTNPLFQLAVQSFCVVLGSLQTLDEIVIVASQPEGGFNHAMVSLPGAKHHPA
jgi:hypothetical protein